jgi:hypothetical protein
MLPRRNKWAEFTIIASLFFLATCTVQQSARSTAQLSQPIVVIVTPTTRSVFMPTPTQNPFSEMIDRQEKFWQSKNIISYRLTAHLDPHFTTDAGDFGITVKGGTIVEKKCLDAPFGCQHVTWPNLTVPDLFQEARAMVDFPTNVNANISDCVRITVDQRYGFPNNLHLDCPDVYDDERDIKVTAFEVLE